MGFKRDQQQNDEIQGTQTSSKRQKLCEFDSVFKGLEMETATEQAQVEL